MILRLVFSAALLGFVACNKAADDGETAPSPAPQAPQTTTVTEAPRAIALPPDPAPPGEAGGLANLAAIIERFELAPYHRAGHHGQALTIAILDNGFAHLASSLGRYLPPDLKVEAAPIPAMQTTTHGTRLAEIVHALATGRARYDAQRPSPRILLLNTNGFTNLTAAVDKVIAEKADIALYAQVWEYGGNGEGDGFINREVKRATDAGVLWINAAGNLGRATWHGPIALGAAAGSSGAKNVKLPYEDRYVRFTVEESGTPVKIVLAWNDFDESKDYKTTQDLDLVLESAGNELAAARLIQDGSGASTAAHSAHAREILDVVLAAGTYRLRVEAKSANFDAASRARITVSGWKTEVIDAVLDDTILIPADSPAVLAVGALDDQTSGQATARGKPEVKVVSEVRFGGGASFTGTSAGSALAAGVLAVYMSAHGKLTKAEVDTLLRGGTLGPELTLPAPP